MTIIERSFYWNSVGTEIFKWSIAQPTLTYVWKLSKNDLLPPKSAIVERLTELKIVFFVIVVDVHNLGITVGFGLLLHSVWSLTQGWSASPCVVTVQFDRSPKPTATLINRPQRIWEKMFPLCEKPQNGTIGGEVRVSF